MGRGRGFVIGLLALAGCAKAESGAVEPAPSTSSAPVLSDVDPNHGVPRCQPKPYEGIGLASEVKAGVIVVTGLTRGAPAEAAGLRAGDIIKSVDGRATAGHPFVEVHSWMLGPAETRVVLGVERDGVALTITIERVLLKATC